MVRCAASDHQHLAVGRPHLCDLGGFALRGPLSRHAYSSQDPWADVRFPMTTSQRLTRASHLDRQQEGVLDLRKKTLSTIRIGDLSTSIDHAEGRHPMIGRAVGSSFMMH